MFVRRSVSTRSVASYDFYERTDFFFYTVLIRGKGFRIIASREHTDLNKTSMYESDN